MQTFLNWARLNIASVVAIVIVCGLIGLNLSGCQLFDPQVDVPPAIREALPETPVSVPLSKTDRVLDAFVLSREQQVKVDAKVIAQFAEDQADAQAFKDNMDALLSGGLNMISSTASTAIPGIGAAIPLILGTLTGLFGYRSGVRRGATVVVNSVDSLRAESKPLDAAFTALTTDQKAASKVILQDSPIANEVVSNS